MGDFVKKTIVGYKSLDGGYSDPECTHVIMTKEEYDEILEEQRAANLAAVNAKNNAEKKIQKAQREADRKAQKAAEDAQKAIEEIRGELEGERAESAHQRALNENLLRVAKERANADRGIRPKKEHTGYAVASSGEKEYRYKDGNNHWRKKLLWETVIQSPYTVDMPEAVARRQIMAELLNEDGERLIDRIGIDTVYRGSYAAMRDDYEWCQAWLKDPGQYNIMLQPSFRANFRAGYWEIVFFHTKPLGIVPREMRLR